MSKLKVFYDARQVVEHNQSASPSAGKPKLVVEQWQQRGYDFEFGTVNPITREDFYKAHAKEYVDGVLDCKINNGFENRQKDVADSFHWTSGSMLSASLEAIASKNNTCSPTSGFHHAEWYEGGGYCTFNGLLVSAIHLKEKNLVNKVGILDIDHHYGNGTDDILQRLSLDYVEHYTFGADNSNYQWKGGMRAELWLQSLPNIVEEFADCDIVMYQAGADPHVHDPYGGALTDAQLRERDRIVFTELKKLNIPVVWNLSGGYQTPIQKVLDIHNATMEECLKVM
jgi:acetoin utilization deacetylase AcuC-like enzyme